MEDHISNQDANAPLPMDTKGMAQDGPPPYKGMTPPYYYSEMPESKTTNEYGIAGFVVSLVSFLGVPFLIFPAIIGWIVSIILCCLGLKKKPKVFAIIGLCISSAFLLGFLIFFLMMVVACMDSHI